MKHILTLAALVFATSCFGQEACPNVHDINSNGTIDIEDFLSILGLFADVDVDEDGVWDSQDDCLDATACNYLASPTEPCSYLDALGECGGACEGDGDGDGICDDVDTCVGELDECGVCNGPGPTEVVIEDIAILYDSVYLPQLEEWYVYEFGADTTFSYECATEFSQCGDPVSYHGYDYATVLIGERCWFAENLQSELYLNGDTILSFFDPYDNPADFGRVGIYGEGEIDCFNNHSIDGDACDESWALNEYGRLYNGYAVYDSRGLCPVGWHVPTEGEWVELADFLGGDVAASNKMRTDYGWYSGSGSNESGFSALPGGTRAFGDWRWAGLWAYYWGSSTSLWQGELNYLYILRLNADAAYGDDIGIPETPCSVRCIQDSE